MDAKGQYFGFLERADHSDLFLNFEEFTMKIWNWVFSTFIAFRYLLRLWTFIIQPKKLLSFLKYVDFGSWKLVLNEVFQDFWKYFIVGLTQKQFSFQYKENWGKISNWPTIYKCSSYWIQRDWSGIYWLT